MLEVQAKAETKPTWRRPRTGRRSYALAVLAVLCFVGGLFVAQPLIFVSVPLVGVLAFTLTRSSVPDPVIEVERLTERVQIQEGEVTRVRLRVKNRGPRPIDLLQVEDRVHPELRGDNTRSAFSTSLEPGETGDLYYEVSGRSFGVHSLGPIALKVWDATGLFERDAELESYTKIVVFPKVAERLTRMPIRPRRTKSWPGEILARRRGAGMDYHSIRRFAVGDPVKRINWRASARYSGESDELLVNDYVAEVGAEVLVIVDAGRAGSGSFDQSRAHSVRAAISIAERLLHDRDRVGLLTTGANARRISPGYGRRQFDRIAMALLQVEPGDSDFRWWVECSIHMIFPNISQIIFVSPLIEEDSIAAAAELSRDGQRDVIVVSPNPVDMAAHQPDRKNPRERRIALRLAQMERSIQLDRLRSANILVIDWKTDDSLEEVMEVHRRALSKYAALSARNR